MQARVRLSCSDSLIYTGLHSFRRHATLPPRVRRDIRFEFECSYFEHVVISNLSIDFLSFFGSIFCTKELYNPGLHFFLVVMPPHRQPSKYSRNAREDCFHYCS